MSIDTDYVTLDVRVIPALPGFYLGHENSGADLMDRFTDGPNLKVFSPVIGWQVVTYRSADEDDICARTMTSPVSSEPLNPADGGVLIRPDGLIEWGDETFSRILDVVERVTKPRP